jgi:putative ABC transport system substrate-binding protein
LRELGYVEGQNIVLNVRAADGRRDRLPVLAAELAATNPDLIVTATGTAALAVKRVTSTIPIVMHGSADAVEMGIVPSLARPSGNVTGLTSLGAVLAPKRLEILKQTVPSLKRAVVYWCPEAPINHVELRHVSAAAKAIGVHLEPVEVRVATTRESLNDAVRRARPDGLFLVDCTTLPLSDIIDFAMEHRLPTITPYPEWARRGVLLAYGPDTAALARRGADFVDRVLKGAKPADLPVEQPTTFELVINLKTAKALGLTIPQSVLVRADEVIQ